MCNINLNWTEIREWLTALGTVGAAVFAGYAAMSANSQAKKNSEHNEKILKEAVRNREDDVLPVLQRIYSEEMNNGTNPHITLVNVGGPIFDVKANGSGFYINSHFHTRFNKQLYFLRGDIGKISWTKSNSQQVTITFMDMYNNKFSLTQKINKKDEHTCEFVGDPTIPTKV